MKQKELVKRVAVITAFGGGGGAPRAVKRMHDAICMEADFQVDLFMYGGWNDKEAMYNIPYTWFRKLCKTWVPKRIQSWIAVKIASLVNRIVYFLGQREKKQFFLEGNQLDIGMYKEYDIIIIAWWQLLTSAKELTKANCTVVYVLHDMWPITGGCAYSGECILYQQACRSCPYMRKWLRARVNRSAKEKVALLNRVNSYVGVTSEWMKRRCIEAGVKAGQIRLIDNSYPQEVFKYKRERRGRRIVLYFVGDVNDRRKGFSLLAEALNGMCDKELGRFELRILGCNSSVENSSDTSKIKTIYLGRSWDEAEQSTYYNQADWLICPSLEDNSPNTIAEAQLCGLPVIAYEGTGAAELVDSMKGGRLAKGSLQLAESLREALESIERVSEEVRMEISEGARMRYSRRKVSDLIRDLA